MMKNFISTAISIGSLTVLGGFAAAAPAVADNHSTNISKVEAVEAVETNARGKVTKVRIDGKIYDVCMTESQDNCINPRAAGLKWGNRELGYWPGKPASEMD